MMFITGVFTMIIVSTGLPLNVKAMPASKTPPTFPVPFPGCYIPYSTYKGLPIIGINGYVEGSIGGAGNDVCECSESCYNEPGCAYSVWDGGCSLALIGGDCYPGQVAGEFWTGSKPGDTSIGQILNGPCGHLVFNGTSSN